MEPYEWQARFTALIFFLLGIAVLGIWQNVGAGLVLFWIASIGMMAPYFIDHLKAKSKHLSVGGLLMYSAHDPSPIAPTSDDAETGAPALALFPFGGAASSGFHMKDGGTAVNTGGYILAPIDQAHTLSHSLVHISAIPEGPVDLEDIEGISPHFRAAIEAHGFHPVNTKLYVAFVGQNSFNGPTLKQLNLQGIQVLKDGLLSTAKSEAKQALGRVVDNAEVLDTIRKPEVKRRRMMRKQQDMEDEEARNGD